MAATDRESDDPPAADPIDDWLDDEADDLADDIAPHRPWLRPLLIGLAAFFGLVLFALIGLGLMVESGAVPDTAAIPGERLKERTIRFLRERAIIDADERVLYFYAGGFLSLAEDGNLFTDRRVISYWQDEDTGEMQIQRADYPEIVEIVPEYSESWLEDSTILVTTADDDEILLLVSNEGGRDKEFHRRLVETWQARR